MNTGDGGREKRTFTKLASQGGRDGDVSCGRNTKPSELTRARSDENIKIGGG
jgi:hypothetical protein